MDPLTEYDRLLTLERKRRLKRTKKTPVPPPLRSPTPAGIDALEAEVQEARDLFDLATQRFHQLVCSPGFEEDNFADHYFAQLAASGKYRRLRKDLEELKAEYEKRRTS